MVTANVRPAVAPVFLQALIRVGLSRQLLLLPLSGGPVPCLSSWWSRCWL